MRPVLVGIAPSGLNENGQPLSCIGKNSTGYRLQQIVGLSRLEYLRSFNRVNVCPHPMPSTIRASEYAAHAENLMGSLLVGRTVVFLGPNVAECFGIPRKNYNFCELKNTRSTMSQGLAGWRRGMALPCIWSVIPHPSGRNLWYNEQENRELVREHLRSLI